MGKAAERRGDGPIVSNVQGLRCVTVPLSTTRPPCPERVPTHSRAIPDEVPRHVLGLLEALLPRRVEHELVQQLEVAEGFELQGSVRPSPVVHVELPCPVLAFDELVQAYRVRTCPTTQARLEGEHEALPRTCGMHLELSSLFHCNTQSSS